MEVRVQITFFEFGRTAASTVEKSQARFGGGFRHRVAVREFLIKNEAILSLNKYIPFIWAVMSCVGFEAVMTSLMERNNFQKKHLVNLDRVGRSLPCQVMQTLLLQYESMHFEYHI